MTDNEDVIKKDLVQLVKSQIGSFAIPQFILVSNNNNNIIVHDGSKCSIDTNTLHNICFLSPTVHLIARCHLKKVCTSSKSRLFLLADN